MNENERQEVINALKMAQEIADEGLGITGSSVVKDQITLHLIGLLLNRTVIAEMQRGTPCMPFMPGKTLKEFGQAEEIALKLLGEMMWRNPSEKNSDPRWVWQTYDYLLTCAREKIEKGDQEESSTRGDRKE